MEVFLIKLLQFMMAISLLVLLHEMGHMLTAKLFGVRGEKFYLFFDPTRAWTPNSSSATLNPGSSARSPLGNGSSSWWPVSPSTSCWHSLSIA